MDARCQAIPLFSEPEVKKFDKENFSWLTNSRRQRVTVAAQSGWTVISECVCVCACVCVRACVSACVRAACVRAHKHFLSEQHWVQTEMISSVCSLTLTLKETTESRFTASGVSLGFVQHISLYLKHSTAFTIRHWSSWRVEWRIWIWKLKSGKASRRSCTNYCKRNLVGHKVTNQARKTEKHIFDGN